MGGLLIFSRPTIGRRAGLAGGILTELLFSIKRLAGFRGSAR
jgi:hypothetical protein